MDQYMKTKLTWQALPAAYDHLPFDEKLLVITRDGEILFAVFDGDELQVDVPEDYEEDEVDVVYWASISVPEEA
jgi:hypothetical protein